LGVLCESPGALLLSLLAQAQTLDSSTTLPVRCVDCGGSDKVAWIGLIVAVAAAMFAGLAWLIQRREHKAFKARAEFDCKLYLRGNDDDEQEVRGPNVATTLCISIDNRKGERTAEYVLVDVVAPRRVEMFWADGRGVSRKDEGLSRPVDDHWGERAHALSKIVGPVMASAEATEVYVRLEVRGLSVETSDPENTPRAEQVVRVRVEISSDDLPEGRRTIRLYREWTFWRKPQRA
jgi:hypothetical protein